MSYIGKYWSNCVCNWNKTFRKFPCWCRGTICKTASSLHDLQNQQRSSKLLEETIWWACFNKIPVWFSRLYSSQPQHWWQCHSRGHPTGQFTSIIWLKAAAVFFFPTLIYHIADDVSISFISKVNDQLLPFLSSAFHLFFLVPLQLLRVCSNKDTSLLRGLKDDHTCVVCE